MVIGRGESSSTDRRRSQRLDRTLPTRPERAGLASGRAVAMTSFAVLLCPLTVGTLADATSLTSALGVVPLIAPARRGRASARAPGKPRLTVRRAGRGAATRPPPRAAHRACLERTWARAACAGR